MRRNYELRVYTPGYHGNETHAAGFKGLSLKFRAKTKISDGMIVAEPGPGG
jgi:hypothetical protein